MNELLTALLASELRRLEMDSLAGGQGHCRRWQHELTRRAGTRPGRVRAWIGRGLIRTGERLCAAHGPARPGDRAVLRHG